MSEVVAHYEGLLAQHYTWMLGADFDELVAEQRHLLDSCGAGSIASRNDVALDVGCGSGIHSVALAQLGHDTVLGVDISQTLIAELAARSARFPAIRPVHADLCAGLDDIVKPRSITTAVCMGDTLPHLPDATAVRRLIDDVFDALIPGGVFILSFRDLTTSSSAPTRTGS
jgi:SAM-dependent methyltransferase